MTTTTLARPAPAMDAEHAEVNRLRAFVEHECDLLDERRYDEWAALFADDGAYWVPAQREQADFLSHVSIFYDDKTILKTRVARLNHDMIHCQDPSSACVHVVSNFRLEPADSKPAEGLVAVSSKFIMLEDRYGAPQRVLGGRYLHVLRDTPQGLAIVLKRVDLTNCDHSFPALAVPF